MRLHVRASVTLVLTFRNGGRHLYKTAPLLVRHLVPEPFEEACLLSRRRYMTLPNATELSEKE